MNSTSGNTNDTIITAIEQLTSAVLNTKAAPKIGLDITLWNTSDVADYIGIAYKYASEHIVTLHTFPNALRLPTRKETKGHPRWYAGDVIAWVSNHKES